MHPNPRRIVPVVLIIVVLASLAYWFFVVRPAQAATGELSASGTIEATQIRSSAELGGKALEVLANEGDSVKAGDILVQFDPALLNAQRAQAVAALAVAKANAAAAQSNAEAAQSNADAARATVSAAEATQTAAQTAVGAAQANLDLLVAGATAEQLRAAQAQAEQAQANYQAAQASYAALISGARPEDVAAARSRLDLARKEYYNITVVLTSQQIEEFHTAWGTAEINREQADVRKNDLEQDTRTPYAAIDAAQTAIYEAYNASDTAKSALDAVNSSMPFYQQLAAARQSWELAQLNLDQAKARQTFLNGVADMTQDAKDSAQSAVDDAQKLVDDAKAAYDTLNTSDQADRLKAAWDESQKALADLNKLARGGSAPLESVLHQLDAAAAGETVAQANYQNLKNGARPEQIAAAQAQVDAAKAQSASAEANIISSKAKADAAQSQAEAARSQADAAQAQVDAAQAAILALDVQIAKLTILAPAPGVILTRGIEPGEVASPGATLFTLADLTRLTITVYVPEDRYGEITLGQTASVTVDSFSGETFSAAVVHIAGKAEFTPRNVQTAEGRRSTVFAVKLTIENTDGRLKPGMPADVEFGK